MMDRDAIIQDLLVETQALKSVVYRLSCVLAGHATLLGGRDLMEAALQYRPVDASEAGENVVSFHPTKNADVRAAIDARVDEILSQISDCTKSV